MSTITSTALRAVYSGADLNTVRLLTLDIELPGGEHVRLVQSFEDQMLGVNGVLQRFEACGIDLSLPVRDTSGNQFLRFGLGIVDGRPHRLIAQALEAGQAVYLVYREYLHTDPTVPASAPKRMLIQGGDMNFMALQVDASYFDMLGIAWPRDRYTVDKAPGVKYQ